MDTRTQSVSTPCWDFPKFNQNWTTSDHRHHCLPSSGHHEASPTTHGSPGFSSSPTQQPQCSHLTPLLDTFQAQGKSPSPFTGPQDPPRRSSLLSYTLPAHTPSHPGSLAWNALSPDTHVAQVCIFCRSPLTRCLLQGHSLTSSAPIQHFLPCLHQMHALHSSRVQYLSISRRKLHASLVTTESSTHSSTCPGYMSDESW